MSHAITERDLRHPDYRDGEPSDFERRQDGKIVRKDRWELGIRAIATQLLGARAEFEIPELVEAVRRLHADALSWTTASIYCENDLASYASDALFDIKLPCGSVLTRVSYQRPHYFVRKDIGAHVFSITREDIDAWREHNAWREPSAWPEHLTPANATESLHAAGTPTY